MSDEQAHRSRITPQRCSVTNRRLRAVVRDTCEQDFCATFCDCYRACDPSVLGTFYSTFLTVLRYRLPFQPQHFIGVYR